MFSSCAVAASALFLLAGGGPGAIQDYREVRRQAGTRDGVVVLRAPASKQVLIRGGRFLMGSDAVGVARARMLCELEQRKHDCDNERVVPGGFADELSEHWVSLRDYWLDRTEVTNRAYRRCVQIGRCKAPKYPAARAWMARDELPVTIVSWYDARTYCRWLGARLPTEAEWERAARGWSDRRYPWGNVYNPLIVNHGRFAYNPLDASDGHAELAPVGSFPQGNTPEGISDLAGNVEEWVADWYASSYPDDDAVDPQGPDSGEARVVRGGSFRSGRPWLRAAARGFGLPSRGLPWRGFRCARDHMPAVPSSGTTAP